MVEVFKTNVKKEKEAGELLEKLTGQFPGTRFNFDLMDCDNILRVEGDTVEMEAIVEILAIHDYSCEPLPN